MKVNVTDITAEIKRLEGLLHAEKLEKAVHIEKVNVACIASNEGYFGKIIRVGEEFIYTGVLQDGRFPKWCDPVKPYESKFDKMEAEADEVRSEAMGQPTHNDHGEIQAPNIDNFNKHIQAPIVPSNQGTDSLI